MSNLDKWNVSYAGLDGRIRPYGDDTTYEAGAQWLKGCSLVEDWGCGAGYLTKFVSRDRYRGIDGSVTEFADKQADLTTYRSKVPGIFMRHVLEHDWAWDRILRNALKSFTERMALILFTPINDTKTYDMGWEDPPGVPNISFRRSDLEMIFERNDVFFTYETFATKTAYETETLVRIFK